jgi:hypothetical protein
VASVGTRVAHKDITDFGVQGEVRANRELSHDKHNLATWEAVRRALAARSHSFRSQPQTVIQREQRRPGPLRTKCHSRLPECWVRQKLRRQAAFA